MQYLFHVCFIVLACRQVLPAQYTPVAFVNAELVLHRLDDNTHDENIKTWKDSDSPLKRLVYQYNFPDDIYTYKALFFDGRYPPIIDQVYQQWRAKMTSLEITADAIVYALYDAEQIAIIQLAVNTDGAPFRTAMIAKRIQGKWYPAESDELRALYDVTDFFAIAEPALIEALLGKTPDPEIAAYLDEVRMCSGERKTISCSCLAYASENFAIRKLENGGSPELSFFKKRFGSATVTPDQNALQSVVTQMGLSRQDEQRLRYYAHQQEWMQIIYLLREYDPTITLEDFAQHVHDISGQDKVKVFDLRSDQSSIKDDDQ